MSLSRPRLAVIGAGAAGAACARVAAFGGFNVACFEKSRGVGGRCATRRPFGRGGAADLGVGLDHGAPAAHPPGRPDGPGAALWGALGASRIDLSGPAACGEPGMSALLHPFFRASGVPGGFTLHLETEIVDIAVGNGDYLLRCGGGGVFGPFEAVAVTAPAPQTRELLGAFCPPDETDASYQAVMTVMAAYERPEKALSFADDADRRILAAGPLSSPLMKVIHDSAKPGRSHVFDAWVGHAEAAWSDAHLNADKDWIAETLLPALKQTASALSPDAAFLQDRPAYLAGHRWRYGLVSRPVGAPFWLSAPGAVGAGPVGAAGDWRLGAAVGDALESGARLGEAFVTRRFEAERGAAALAEAAQAAEA